MSSMYKYDVFYKFSGVTAGRRAKNLSELTKELDQALPVRLVCVSCRRSTQVNDRRCKRCFETQLTAYSESVE